MSDAYWLVETSGWPHFDITDEDLAGIFEAWDELWATASDLAQAADGGAR
jgi:hypothetical protein